MNQCRLVKHISDYCRTAPVRCFHLTALVLSGEKHLTSAKELGIKNWELYFYFYVDYVRVTYLSRRINFSLFSNIQFFTFFQNFNGKNM